MKKILLASMLLVGSLFAAEQYGSVTGDDDNTTEVCLGFKPEYVMVIDLDSNKKYELYEDMNDTSHILTTWDGNTSIPESVSITIGSITQDSGTKCYGFSFANVNDQLVYKAER